MIAFHDSLAHVMFWKFLQLKEPWASEMLKTFQNMMSDSKSQYTQTLHAICL